MFRTALRGSRTRRPLLGIIIFTIFLAVALSLIARWNRVGTSAEATENGPTVRDGVPQYEDFTVRVEESNIQVRALLNERVQIVRAPEQPQVKIEVQITTTPAPPPAEEGVTKAPDEQSMGADESASGSGQATQPPPPTSTPVPVAPTQAPVVVQDVNAGRVAFIAHTVQPGQTVFRMTQIYQNTNLDMLARYGVTEASMIVGNVIQVPYANGAACSTGKACPIAKGNTLFSLARLHGTTVQTLQQLNGIGPDFAITAGEAICVP